jgi:hypothetical protein
MSLINSKVVEPSLHVGVDTFFGDSSYGTVNTGAGLTLVYRKRGCHLNRLIENRLEKMLAEFLILISFQHTAVLLLEEKILTVMESTIKMTPVRSCWF